MFLSKSKRLYYIRSVLRPGYIGFDFLCNQITCLNLLSVSHVTCSCEVYNFLVESGLIDGCCFSLSVNCRYSYRNFKYVC